MKTVLSFALFAVCALQSFAQASAPKVPAAAEVNEARQSSFNKVWTTINEKHYDPTFGGVDWKSVRTVYEPQALAPGLSDREFHDVLRRMLAELKLSHFGIHPPTAEMVAAQTGRGVTGIDVLMLDGLPVINRVDAGSPAAQAGVRPGHIVFQIDGKPWKEVTAQLETTLAARKVTEAARKLYIERTIEAAINGKPETTLVL